MEIYPDKKLITKFNLVLVTIAVFELLSAAIIHVIIVLTDGPEISLALSILWWITVGIIVLQEIIGIPLISLWIKNLSYHIEEERVTIFKGILTKTQQNIPYRAVTDFMLQRTLYDRMLGIGAVCIQTAGQSQNPSGYEGKFSGLMDFENIHQSLRTRLKQLHPRSDSATANTISPATLGEILGELKAIRSLLEKK